RTYRAELARALGNLASAGARVTRLEADFARAQQLLGVRSLSREDYDRIEGDRGEAVASSAALKAAVERMRLDLGFTKVTAPVSGRVSRYHVTVGNLVQSADQRGATLPPPILPLTPIYPSFDP